MQTKVNRSSKGTDESATIMQSIVEDLNNVQFDTLGSATSIPTTVGLANGSVWTVGPLNKLGQDSTEGGSSGGPYTYYRNVVICQYTMVVASNSSEHCGGGLNSTRPPELACLSGAVTSNREKLVRVLVGWTDRDGKCHYKNTDFVAFKW